MSHYIYRLFINFLLIHYFIYRLVRWSDPYVQDSLQMLWLAAYLMGLPPTGLYALCWTHGQTLSRYNLF